MIKIVPFSFIFFFLFCFSAHAIGDSFTVRTLVGDDTAPPTTPTALTATPIAQTQIDLSWGASTDDFIFEGYQVFRDAAQIATTTLTTYSDTGLTASTTYTYFVRAYDSFLNISSSSNSVATTTFPVTPTSTPTTTPPNNGGGKEKVELRSFLISPTQETALLSWETNRHAQFELRWGRTSSYELGFVYTELFKRENTTLITDLRPGTLYQYQLISHDREGRTEVLKQGEFTTLDAIDTVAPANVSNLRAVAEEENVRLSWTNPTEPDFAYVRIVRNYMFYPSDPFDGYVVYQNNGDAYLDKDALDEKNVQYYTVFSYDTNGNSSSGAVVAVSVPATSTPVPTKATSSVLSLQFSDIEFVQDNRMVASDDIAADLPLTVRVAYEKLPEHLKTITVTLRHPVNTTSEFSFLLKINKDKTYYEATVAPLRIGGVYPVTMSVFDHTLQQLSSVDGSLTVTRFESEPNILGVPLFIHETQSTPEITLFFWLLLLLVLLYLIYRITRDIPVGKDSAVAFGRARMMASMLLFVLFGGASAYILFSLSRFGMFGSSPEVPVTASILEISGNQILLMSIGALVCIAFVVVVAILISFFKKK